jgi:hypothetical protein
MNLQIHHVISDITGTTGLAILDAILNGERDTEKLARLRDPRIRASQETIAISATPSGLWARASRDIRLTRCGDGQSSFTFLFY